MKNYTLQGLDCANCAVKLEKILAAHPGVRDVSIDFGTLSLRIETDRMDLVKELIAQEEPEIQVLSSNSSANTTPTKGEDDPENQALRRARLREYILLGATGVLLVFFMILEGLGAFPSIPFAQPLVFGTLFLITGWPVLQTAFKNILKGKWHDENFLMAIATLGAFALGDWEEAVGVMVFWRTGEVLQDKAVDQSRSTIRSLAKLRGGKARKKTSSGWEEQENSLLLKGDIIQLHPGDRVPVDGKILMGEGNFDTSSLTGESLPQRKGPGDEICAGYTNLTGLLEVEVLQPETTSTDSRILELVENALHAKSKPEKTITRFARIYTPSVVIGALILALVPPLFLPGFPFQEWIHRALILLVISCPCALVLGIPLSYFAGLGGAARKGILFKGANHLETLGKIKTLTFDKTGTLTLGTFTLQSLHPTKGTSPEQLLALGVEAEGPSPHPLAHSLRRAWIGQPFDLPIDFTEIPGLGVESRWEHKSLWAGNRKYMAKLGFEQQLNEVQMLSHATESNFNSEGTQIHIADGAGYRGWIQMGDTPRPELKLALQRLKTLGVKGLRILSGDRTETVRQFAQIHGFTQSEGNLLPEDKISHFETAMTTSEGPHGYVGDGINDAPVLARADVGIALGIRGTEAALEAADVALMDDDLTKISLAIQHARKVSKLVTQNIVFALGIKVVFLTLGLLGVANLWMAVIADVGAALLVVANSLRGLK